jgi:hypothetical protein
MYWSKILFTPSTTLPYDLDLSGDWRMANREFKQNVNLCTHTFSAWLQKVGAIPTSYLLSSVLSFKIQAEPCRSRAQRAKTWPTQHENAPFMLRTWGLCAHGSSFSRQEISAVDFYATGIKSQPENKPKVSKATA